MTLEARVLAPDEHPLWDRLVAESPEGSPYSTSPYLAALCEATGAEFRILAASRGPELLGGVALYEERVRAGTRVTSRLLLYYNGIVLRTPAGKYPSRQAARQTEVLAALERALSCAGYLAVSLKNRSAFRDARVFLAAGWSAAPSYTYVVPLADLARLWGRVEQNLRRLVARAEREGLRMAEDDDFASFFRLHEQALARKGLGPYLPRRAFEGFFARLRAAGLARLYHVRLPDGRSVASQLVLAGPHPVSHTIAAGSDAACHDLGATAFLRWNVFRDLARLGFSANDLTDAALGPVTHFKSQLGGDLELCLTLRRETATYRAWRWAERLAQRRPAARLTRLLAASRAQAG